MEKHNPLTYWAIGLLSLVVVGLGVVVATRDVTPPASAAAEVAFTPVPLDQRPVVVFIGDSYTAGIGGDEVRWTSVVAREQGWREVNLGRGGTGYRVSAGESGCGLEYCPPYPEMIPAAVDAAPDVVVVSGGRNDIRADGAAIEATFSGLRQALPDVEIIALSPMWDSTPYPGALSEMGSAVRAQVEAIGGRYVEVGHPLDGHSEWVTPDGVHPNAEGYLAIADAVNRALAQAG